MNVFRFSPLTALTLCALCAHAHAGAMQELKNTESAADRAARSSPGAAYGHMRGAYGEGGSGQVYAVSGRDYKATANLTGPAAGSRKIGSTVPAVSAAGAVEEDKGFFGSLFDKPIVKYGLAGGAGALAGGLLVGGFTAIALGAGAGLGGMYLYSQGHKAAGIGVGIGGIAGLAIGGPLGGLIGAAVGGLVGHFGSKLFSSLFG